MRDRFGLIQRLDFFEEEDMIEILRRACNLWDIEIEESALTLVSIGSRGTASIGLASTSKSKRLCSENSDIKVC
jgi:holliday junction DNA helicase RuvB